MTIEKADLEKFLRDRKKTLNKNLDRLQAGKSPIAQIELGLLAKAKASVLYEVAEKFGIDLKKDPKKKK